MTEYERFGLVFRKTRVYKFGHSTLDICGRERSSFTVNTLWCTIHSFHTQKNGKILYFQTGQAKQAVHLELYTITGHLSLWFNFQMMV